MRATCETCRWWRQSDEDSLYGLCLCNPPGVSLNADGDPVTLFPEIDEDGWCSKHQPHEAAPAEPGTAALTAQRDRAQQACEQMGARITGLEDALRPFAEAADALEVAPAPPGVDAFCWGSMEHRASISTWLGPSDFGRARDALSGALARPSLDPETRRVLEDVRDGLLQAAYGAMTEGRRAGICEKHAEDIRAHLANLDGGSND